MEALACIVWDHGSKDISGLDGPKVAAGQYIFSARVIFGSAWSPCWCLSEFQLNFHTRSANE